MKTIKLFILFCAALFIMEKVSAQANASLNILTLNSGVVGQGAVVDVLVTVGNTGPVSSIGANKVRAQISVPSALVSLLPNAEQTGLPPGWTITVNTGSAITVCNGSDIITPGTTRDIYIKVQGNAVGGPSTVNGNLLFSSGTSCTAPGSLPGDNTADNSSTSSVQVYDPVPVTLSDFSAVLVNCQPLLKWTTESEINSDHFEIERTNTDNAGWALIKSVTAKGNTASKTNYAYTDIDELSTLTHILYRLKMVDNNGNYKYSPVLPVYINCKTSHAYVYPNPVKNGRLYVSLTGTTGYADVNLLSASGQVILKTKFDNGTNYLDISNIANGLYILNIKAAEGFSKQVKVIVQH